MKFSPHAIPAWLGPGILGGATVAAALLSWPAVGANPQAVNLTNVKALTATDGSTSGALCSYSQSTPVVVGNNQSMTNTSNWRCSGSQRTLTGNGVPNHSTGVFPAQSDPNPLSAQSVTAAMPLSPAVASSTSAQAHVIGFALNSVKFDPATAGGCTVTNGQTSCVMIGNSGAWNLEALGQTTFNFGADSSNAHTQPNGSYHYHGMRYGTMPPTCKKHSPASFTCG